MTVHVLHFPNEDREIFSLHYTIGYPIESLTSVIQPRHHPLRERCNTVTKSAIVTARISVELMEKIKYLEISVTDVIKDSLENEVADRERLLAEMGKWKHIGGLSDAPDPIWKRLEGLSGEELTRARIRHIASLKKEARRFAREAV